MRDVLNAALPLADMIWNRETATGIFETPERKAELEARIRSVTTLIKNDSVRRHYEQDMRERLMGFSVLSTNRRATDRERGRILATNQAGDSTSGQQFIAAKSGKVGCIAKPVEQLACSKKGKAGIPLREAALVMGVINHPAILKRYFDEFVELAAFLTDAMAELRQQMSICMLIMLPARETVEPSSNANELLRQTGAGGITCKTR